jgi:Protein of unknown function (DUF3822)
LFLTLKFCIRAYVLHLRFTMERLIVNSSRVHTPEQVTATDVQISSDSLMIVRRMDNTVISVKAWAFDPLEADQALLRIFGSEHALSDPNTRFWVLAPHFALLPRRMAADSGEHLAFDGLAVDKIQTQALSGGDITGYYALTDVLEKRLLNRSVQCIQIQLLERFKARAQPEQGAVFAHVFHTCVWVAAFDRGKLIFANSFAFDNAKDALYFILLAYTQAQLDPAQIPLQLSGTIVQDSEIYRMLTRFIRQIQWTAPSPTLTDLPDGVKPWFLVFLVPG